MLKSPPRFVGERELFSFGAGANLCPKRPPLPEAAISRSVRPACHVKSGRRRVAEPNRAAGSTLHCFYFAGAACGAGAGRKRCHARCAKHAPALNDGLFEPVPERFGHQQKINLIHLFPVLVRPAIRRNVAELELQRIRLTEHVCLPYSNELFHAFHRLVCSCKR